MKNPTDRIVQASQVLWATEGASKAVGILLDNARSILSSEGVPEITIREIFQKTVGRAAS